MTIKKRSSYKASQKKRTQRHKKNFEANYAFYKEKKGKLGELIEREKKLAAALTYHEFTPDKSVAKAIDKELSRVRKKKHKLNREIFRLYRAAEKERHKARQLPRTRATIDLVQRKDLSSRIFKDLDLYFLHPNYKQFSCGDIIDSIELVPQDFYIFDWFGLPYGPHGLGHNIKEKPDHEHYSINGRNLAVSISNTSSFEIENPLIRCINILGGLTVDGLIAPEDDYGMLWLIKEVQLVQYRTDKPIGQIDFTEDVPLAIYRSECGPWYRQYFPETYGITGIGERESALNIVITNFAVGDKFFLAQYVKIETDNATVSFEHPNGIGLVRMPHPTVAFYGN